MTMYYSNPAREKDPHALPDVEVFWIAEDEVQDWSGVEASGWYWWFCQPGCLPDGEPMGPYDTESDALADAREDGLALTEEDLEGWNLAETINKEFKL